MNTPQVQYAFFLGGQDAEMATIRDLLLAAGYSRDVGNLFDASLTWGAKLSSYQEALTALPAYITPVLIELEPDIPIPPHAVIIDHHNDRAGKDIPTSLEQIAALLGKELTHRQKLIAANDKGHSKGMRQAGATEEEIEEIRHFDRLCQGVTEEEERAAEELCATREGWISLPQSTILVPWNFPHTSPLVDRITPYYSNILIWSDSGRLFFTGKGSIIHKLTEHFRTVEHASKPYFGGNLPEEGFWGITVSGIKDIEELSYLMSNLLSIHSSHIFTFPFIVTKDCGTDRVPIVDSLFLQDKITQNLVIAENLEWQPKTNYEPDVLTQTSAGKALEETLLWNSYRYFYPHVLHNYYPAEENDVYWFSLEAENSSYTISVQGKPYLLKLNRVLLKIFSTGICLLEFHLHNEKYPSLSDVKRINDFGRRLYPQFLGYPDSNTFDDFLSASQKNFFSTGINVSLNGKSLAGEDELPYKNEHFLKPLSANTKNSTTKPLERNDERILPYFIRKLLQPLCIDPQDQKSKRHIEGVLDDRMFVVCWHGNDAVINQLNKYDDKTSSYNYDRSGDWYSYAFIDAGSPSIAHQGMKEELLKKITYPRFVEWGTLYGATRYSFVGLTGSGDYGVDIVRRHMETLYADMMAMLLVQRASIVAFNNEITTISEQLHGLEKKEGDQNKPKRTENEILKAVDILHARIVAFDNRLAHREVTPQEQGIELYKLARDRMDIPEQMDELRQNMEALHNHFEMRNAKQVNKTVKLLTIVSVIFIPLNLVIALWSTIVSMIDSGGITLDHRDGVVFGAIFLSSVLIYMFTFSAIKKMNESEYPVSQGIHFWDFICDAVSFRPLKIIIFFTLLFVLTLAMTAMFF